MKKPQSSYEVQVIHDWTFWTVLSQDPIYAELRKDERLTKESGEILQAQVCILLRKIRSDAQNHNHGVTILVIFVFISFKEL